MFRAVHFVVVALMLTCAVASAQAGQAVERGRQVYAAEKCSVCHAAEMAAKTKATRKPVMKSYGHLAKDDVDALVTLLQTLK